jgi:glutaredoxin 3
VKEFLSQKGVPYAERDIGADQQAMEELVALGYLTTPVILVDGEVVIGFNRQRLEELLA